MAKEQNYYLKVAISWILLHECRVCGCYHMANIRGQSFVFWSSWKWAELYLCLLYPVNLRGCLTNFCRCLSNFPFLCRRFLNKWCLVSRHFVPTEAATITIQLDMARVQWLPARGDASTDLPRHQARGRAHWELVSEKGGRLASLGSKYRDPRWLYDASFDSVKS